MSKNNGSDAATATDAPLAPATDPNAVGHKLLEDLQTKFAPAAAPEAVQKLVQDGILPEGSTVINFDDLKGQLNTDQRTLHDIQTQQPSDTTDATKAVTDAQATQTAAQTALDTAQGKIDPLEAQIKKRNDLDASVRNAYNTLATGLNQIEIGDGQLRDIANDTTQSQTMRDAANVLLGTIHDETYGSGKAIAHRNTSDYTDPDFISFTGGIHFNEATVNRGLQKHADQNTADQTTLTSLTSDRDNAKAALDAAGTDLTAKQQALTAMNDSNTALVTQKQALETRVQDEQAALDTAKPNTELDALGRVTKGGGYYQVAEALLGIAEGGHSTQDEKELKMLTRILQSEEKLLNGGKLPKYLKVGDQLLAPENLGRIMSELQASLAPEQPAQTEVAPPNPPAGQGGQTDTTSGPGGSTNAAPVGDGGQPLSVDTTTTQPITVDSGTPTPPPSDVVGPPPVAADTEDPRFSDPNYFPQDTQGNLKR